MNNKVSDEVSDKVCDFGKALFQKYHFEVDFMEQLNTKRFEISNWFGAKFMLKGNTVNLDLNQELATGIVNLLPQKNTNEAVRINGKHHSFIWKNSVVLAGHVFVKTEGREKKCRHWFSNDVLLPDGFLKGFREALKAKYRFKFIPSARPI